MAVKFSWGLVLLTLQQLSEDIIAGAAKAAVGGQRACRCRVRGRDRNPHCSSGSDAGLKLAGGYDLYWSL